MQGLQYNPTFNPLFAAAASVGQGQRPDPMQAILELNARRQAEADQTLQGAQQLQLAHAQMVQRGSTPTQNASYSSSNSPLGQALRDKMVQERFDAGQTQQQAQFDARLKSQQEAQQAQLQARDAEQTKQQQARDAAQQEKERVDALARQAAGQENDRRSQREQAEKIAAQLREAGIDPNAPPNQRGITQGVKKHSWYDSFIPGDQSYTEALPSNDPNLLAYQEYQRLSGGQAPAQNVAYPAAPTSPPQGGGRGARGPQPNGPVRVNTPADAMALPPGTAFITPDGRIKVRP